MTLIDPAGPEISIGDAAQAAIKTIEQKRKERMTFGQASKILRADFDAGKLFWLPRPAEAFATEHHARTWNTRFAGEEAFSSLSNQGYRHGKIGGQTYKAHRVLWLLYTGEWPDDQLDHINGIRSDNRISNLRPVSNSENCRNQRMSLNNTTGVTGVVWHSSRNKWHARIKVDGKYRHLGLFESFELAVAARKAAEATFGFHENHGRTA